MCTCRNNEWLKRKIQACPVLRFCRNVVPNLKGHRARALPEGRGWGRFGIFTLHCTALFHWRCSTSCHIGQNHSPKAYCPTTGRFLQYLLGGSATKQSELRRNMQQLLLLPRRVSAVSLSKKHATSSSSSFGCRSGTFTNRFDCCMHLHHPPRLRVRATAKCERHRRRLVLGQGLVCPHHWLSVR